MRKSTIRVEPPLVVALFDVRIPKRMVLRKIQPHFRDPYSGKCLVRFRFLNRTPALTRRGTCCDRLSDEELLLEAESRVMAYWEGRLCFLFTADRDFNGLLRKALRGGRVLPVVIPLCGRSHISRRRVAQTLSRCIVPLLRKALFRVREKGAPAAFEYYQKNHPLLLFST